MHGRKKKSQDQSNTFINFLAKVLLASPCNCKSCCFVQIKAFNQLRRWLLVVGWGGCRGQLTGLGCTPRGKTKKCFVVLIWISVPLFLHLLSWPHCGSQSEQKRSPWENASLSTQRRQWMEHRQEQHTLTSASYVVLLSAYCNSNHLVWANQNFFCAEVLRAFVLKSRFA